MSKIKSEVVWRLRAGADRRFRGGHPWVYSNELMESPKGIEPGEPVQLCDAGGKFLARGYGNPASLISFRVLTRDPEIKDPHSSEGLFQSLVRSGRLREACGLADVSHRLCFGEADFLPGLIIDRYRLENSQVFVVQAHTAGADRWIPNILEVLEKYVAKTGFSGFGWNQSSVVLRNDLSVRKLEGLQEEEPRILKGEVPIDAKAAFRVPGLTAAIPFKADLLKGQKTGFFLDQSANIQLASLRLSHLKPAEGAVRILDLCSYVGQWGSQLAAVFRSAGLKVEVTAVDASASALDFARRNVEAQGATFKAIEGDVLKDLGTLPDRGFDLVVCDPPALIKGRKDIPVGKHAYLQLNTQVFRLVRQGGGVVSCSCSGLLEEEEFLKILSKAAYRNRRTVQWIARGSQGPDHPMLLEFPEGRYLKCWIGMVRE